MSYLALYRKYRSKNFDELVGQEAIKTTLVNSLKAQKISHAYLFSGPRGTGKTSVARLFAKALNCEKGIGEIDNECSSCKAIDEGTHPDVIEIDAASNSGVDEVRNLIDRVKYSPIKGKYKVYIIDEVHMMTNNAFNALLKTLEEPPSYCVFILCTTEPYKLLPTILSRCQRYEFKRINDSELKKLLTRVLVNEGVSCSSTALDLIVELANGGARDALSLLDQIISYSGNDIKDEDIIKLFGLVPVKEKIRLLEFIKSQATTKVLQMYEDFLNRNVDLSRFVNETLLLLKDALVYEKTRNKDLIVSSKEEDAKQIMIEFDESELMRYIETFIKCQNDFKTTSNPQFLFEIYLLKLLESKPVEKTISKHQIKEEITQIKPIIKETQYVNKEPQVINTTQKSIINEEKKEEEKIPDFKIKPSQEPLPVLAVDGEVNQVNLKDLIKLVIIANKEERLMLLDRWNKLQELIYNPNDGAVASLLLESKPYLVTGANLLLICDNKAPAKKINIKENQESIQKVVKKLLGRKVTIYALNRDESTEFLKIYRNLQEINQLPKKNEVEDKKIF